jgi:peptide-methionine (S)-S-oxide reductase
MFYGAEGYHQKYYLRNSQDVLRVFKESYPSESDFTASTAVARVNGYLGGYGKIAEVENELLLTGLPRETIQKIVGFLGEKYRN